MRSKDSDSGTTAGVSDRSAASRLRLLDFDDLFLLSHLLAGSTIAATAKQLGLTQPAITQRVRKIERVFAEPILQKVGRHVRLTKDGRAICLKAADALALMRGVTAESAGQGVALGVAAVGGTAWAWPAVSELHSADPTRLFHCSEGTPDELGALLDTGSLDACVMPLARSSGPHSVVELQEEEVLMVARPDAAARLTSTEALGGELLLELDRSLSLLSRLPADLRAHVRFRDIWYLGSPANIVAAAAAGYGVAILPASLVRAALAAQRVVAILPEIEIEPIRYGLYYRRDRGVEAPLLLLAEKLRSRR